MSHNPYQAWFSLEDRRSDVESQRENSARPALSTVTHDTTGTGHIVVEAPFRFDTSFTAEPAVVSGSYVVKGPGTGWQQPMVNAGVYRWQRDGRGFYTGAYLYFVVRIDPVNATRFQTDPEYRALQREVEQLRQLANTYDNPIRYAGTYGPTPSDAGLERARQAYLHSRERKQAELAELAASVALLNVTPYEKAQYQDDLQRVQARLNQATPGSTEHTDAQLEYDRVRLILDRIAKQSFPVATVRHHLFFHGPSWKDLPGTVLTDLQDMQPKAVPFFGGDA